MASQFYDNQYTARFRLFTAEFIPGWVRVLSYRSVAVIIIQGVQTRIELAVFLRMHPAGDSFITGEALYGLYNTPLSCGASIRHERLVVPFTRTSRHAFS
jgi:hypothetical protein